MTEQIGFRFGATERDRVSWRPDGSTESLVIELAELFGPV